MRLLSARAVLRERAARLVPARRQRAHRATRDVHDQQTRIARARQRVLELRGARTGIRRAQREVSPRGRRLRRRRGEQRREEVVVHHVPRRAVDRVARGQVHDVTVGVAHRRLRRSDRRASGAADDGARQAAHVSVGRQRRVHPQMDAERSDRERARQRSDAARSGQTRESVGSARRGVPGPPQSAPVEAAGIRPEVHQPALAVVPDAAAHTARAACERDVERPGHRGFAGRAGDDEVSGARLGQHVDAARHGENGRPRLVGLRVQEDQTRGCLHARRGDEGLKGARVGERGVARERVGAARVVSVHSDGVARRRTRWRGRAGGAGQGRRLGRFGTWAAPCRVVGSGSNSGPREGPIFGNARLDTRSRGRRRNSSWTPWDRREGAPRRRWPPDGGGVRDADSRTRLTSISSARASVWSASSITRLEVLARLAVAPRTDAA